MDTAPGPRASGSACAIDDNRILVFGGYDGNDFLDDMWILETEDPSTGEFSLKWTEVKKPAASSATNWPSARSGHSVEVVGQFIVMFGGRHRHGRFNDVRLFDTSKLQWNNVQIAGSSPRQRKTHAMTRIGHRFFMFGGHDGAEWLSDFHVLELGSSLESLQENPTIDYPPSTMLQDLAGLLPFPGDSVRSMLEAIGYFSESGCKQPVRGPAEAQLSQEGGSPPRKMTPGRHPKQWRDKTRQAAPARSSSATALPLVVADGPRPPHEAASATARRTPPDGGALDDDDNVDGNDAESVSGMGDRRSEAVPVAGAGAGGGDMDGDQRMSAPSPSMPWAPSSTERSLEPSWVSRDWRQSDAAVPQNSPEAGDVTFLVEGYRVALHRCILAARSEYFRVMFSCGMSESIGREIPLEGTSLPGFLAVVRFLYTDQLPPEEELEDYLPLLLEEAHKLGLESLSLRCQRLLEERMDVHNVSSMLQLADNVQAFPLRAACHKFMVRHFSAVRLEPSFLQLRHDLLREVLYRSARRRWTTEQRRMWPLSALEPSATHDHDGSRPGGGEELALEDEAAASERQSALEPSRGMGDASSRHWQTASAESSSRGRLHPTNARSRPNDTQEVLAGSSPTEGDCQRVLPVSPPRGPSTPNSLSLPTGSSAVGGLTFSSRLMDHCGGSDGIGGRGAVSPSYMSGWAATAASEHSPVEAHEGTADSWNEAAAVASSPESPVAHRTVSSVRAQSCGGGGAPRSRKRRREDRDASGGEEEEGTLEQVMDSSGDSGSAASEGGADVAPKRRRLAGREAFSRPNQRRHVNHHASDQEQGISAVTTPAPSSGEGPAQQRAGSESPVARTPNVTN